MMIHTSTPAAAMTTRNRQAQAAAVRMPGETASSPAGGVGSALCRQNIPPVYEARIGAGCGMPATACTGAPVTPARRRPVAR